MAPSMSLASVNSVVLESVATLSHDIKSENHIESAGLVAVLCGVAVACVVAIVAVVRAPTHVHEPLPQSSE